jgi:hypothetical protein
LKEIENNTAKVLSEEEFFKQVLWLLNIMQMPQTICFAYKTRYLKHTLKTL